MGLIIRKATEADAADMANIHIRSWEAAYCGIIPDDFIKEKNAGRPLCGRKSCRVKMIDIIF